MKHWYHLAGRETVVFICDDRIAKHWLVGIGPSPTDALLNCAETPVEILDSVDAVITWCDHARFFDAGELVADSASSDPLPVSLQVAIRGALRELRLGLESAGA